MQDSKTTVDQAAVEKAFEALETFAWGVDRDTLKPIDEAALATRGEAAGRKELESKLVEVLQSDAPRAAKGFAFRKLTIIGTAACVPSVAALLPDKDLSHMARYALERIPAPEAAQAMREALPKVDGELKVGVIGSLGVCGDAASVGAIASALSDSEAVVAVAAARALSNIGTPEAVKALAEFAKKAPKAVKVAATDGCLVCADRLLADGKKDDAVAIYKSLAGAEQRQHVRMAAARGLLMAAGKK